MTLLFLLLTGGLVLFEYNGDSDHPVPRGMMLMMYLLVFLEVIAITFEYPAYVFDGIIFASMGFRWLANVMLAIFGMIILFIIFLICTRINGRKWHRFLTPTPLKLIATGVILIALLAGTELWNGAYSFDSIDEFNEVKTAMEPYDNHFFPTKYVKHHNKIYDQECIAVYPFDVTLPSGKQPIAYKVDIYMTEFEDGTEEMYFYPFNWKQYEPVDPVSFDDLEYVPPVTYEQTPSPTDTSASDAAAETEAANQ